jgi:hypothetical protein
MRLLILQFSSSMRTKRRFSQSLPRYIASSKIFTLQFVTYNRIKLTAFSIAFKTACYDYAWLVINFWQYLKT